MNAITETKASDGTKPLTGLALMRAPFPPHQVSKLPKPTRQQTEAVKANFKAGIRCKICGLWHHPNVVHLDYVGHAALTDRLLECDPKWNWEPLAKDDHGRPIFDEFGGMWIRLTVCGVSRMGYGHPDGKRGGDALKEVIGDALRNAAMRFGAALDLWHKGDLHLQEEHEPPQEPEAQPRNVQEPDRIMTACDSLARADTLARLKAIWDDLPPDVQKAPRVALIKDQRKVELSAPQNADLAAYRKATGREE